MPMSSNTIWGKNVADAIKAIGVTPGTLVNDTQLEAMWAAIKAETLTELGQADVAPGTFANGGGPVGGVGGPVS